MERVDIVTQVNENIEALKARGALKPAVVPAADGKMRPSDPQGSKTPTVRDAAGFTFADGLGIAGFVVLVAGVSQQWGIPAGMITAGAGLITAAYHLAK